MTRRKSSMSLSLSYCTVLSKSDLELLEELTSPLQGGSNYTLERELYINISSVVVGPKKQDFWPKINRL